MNFQPDSCPVVQRVLYLGGIPRHKCVVFIQCRHTFITNAIRAGMDLPVLEAIVGHVDRETTKIYKHLRDSDLVEAVQGLETENFAVFSKSVSRPKTTSKKPSKKFA